MRPIPRNNRFWISHNAAKLPLCAGRCRGRFDDRRAWPLDPVFALLEANKAAWAHFNEIRVGDDKAFEVAGRASDVALNAITSTPPRTLAGMRAVIEYLVVLDGHVDYPADPVAIVDLAVAAAGGCVRTNEDQSAHLKCAVLWLRNHLAFSTGRPA